MKLYVEQDTIDRLKKQQERSQMVTVDPNTIELIFVSSIKTAHYYNDIEIIIKKESLLTRFLKFIGVK